uniref:SAM domain-containing protein n=1 Tax=Glossina palpalis gambiensis TaxID=67801 RepID=A0A1B0B8D3_9MUSC
MQRRMSVTIREYKFFRSFSQKFENWPKRKAEALWRKMRERKIAEFLCFVIYLSAVLYLYCCIDWQRTNGKIPFISDFITAAVFTGSSNTQIFKTELQEFTHLSILIFNLVSQFQHNSPTTEGSLSEGSEIEAVEACKWLRAAGFPQYAQMYEEVELQSAFKNSKH